MAYRHWVLALVGSCAAAGAEAQKDEAACKPLWEANAKTVTTSHHLYSTTTRAGETMAGESITINDKSYFKLNGQWQPSGITTADQLQQEQESIRDAKVHSCRAIKDDIVNGERATLYHVHQVNDIATYESSVWIAKSSGLTLRAETDVDSGGGDAGKMHVSARYDYSNVKAPPGV